MERRVHCASITAVIYTSDKRYQFKASPGGKVSFVGIGYDMA